MHPRSLLAGALIAILLATGAALYFSGNLTRDLPDKVVEAARKLSPFQAPPLEAPVEPAAPASEAGFTKNDANFQQFSVRRGTELVVQTPADVHTSYGLVHVDSGTRVLAIRDEREGVRAEFAGRELVLPRWVFKLPDQPLKAPRMGKLVALLSPTPPPPPQPAHRIPPASPSPPDAAPLPAPSPTVVSNTPTPSLQSAAAATPHPDAGVQHFAKWLLIAQGDKGRGSASIILFKGQPMIVTNAHVISGNPNVKFRSLASKEVKPGKLSVSLDYDLATFEQSDIDGGIPIMEDLDQSAAIGDEVMVLGNSQGSSVVTEIAGTIKGIGPDLIEVDAKFVEGNSGSPIIHVKSGKVIGIATFATLRKLSALGKDSQFAEVRRFGYRLDTAARWEQPDPRRFANEAATLEVLRKRTDAVVALARDIYENGRVSFGTHQQGDNPLRSAVTQYLQVVDSRTKLSPADYIAAKKRLFRSAVTLAAADMQGIDASGFSAYHRRVIDAEREDRKFLVARFSEMLDIQDAGEKIRFR